MHLEITQANEGVTFLLVWNKLMSEMDETVKRAERQQVHTK